MFLLIFFVLKLVIYILCFKSCRWPGGLVHTTRSASAQHRHSVGRIFSLDGNGQGRRSCGNMHLARLRSGGRSGRALHGRSGALVARIGGADLKLISFSWPSVWVCLEGRLNVLSIAFIPSPTLQTVSRRWNLPNAKNAALPTSELPTLFNFIINSTRMSIAISRSITLSTPDEMLSFAPF